MYARKIKVTFAGQPCPIKWLDNFSMRNFTNDAVFDDTLPLSDGVLEAGARVPIEALCAAMQDWFLRKGYITKDDVIRCEE